MTRDHGASGSGDRRGRELPETHYLDEDASC